MFPYHRMPKTQFEMLKKKFIDSQKYIVINQTGSGHPNNSSACLFRDSGLKVETARTYPRPPNMAGENDFMLEV